MPEFRHWLRLGTHAEKDYLVKLRGKFDGLVLNANLVESTSSSLAIFAQSLAKPYLIDPITYSFALNPRLLLSQPRQGPQQLRSTFASLAARYRVPEGIAGGRPLTPTDFALVDQIEEFVQAVLIYQRDRLYEALEQDAAFLIAADVDPALIPRPSTLLAPYFAEEREDDWLDFNVRALRFARELAMPVAISGVLAYDSTRLTASAVRNLALRYAASGASQIVVWPADLDEHVSSADQLNSYADAVSILSAGDVEVTAAFGGYFAVLLAYRGMRGLSHGVGYGDKRNLQPVLGGGLPPARFYVRAIRDVVAMGDMALLAVGLDEREFRERVCSCVICTELLQTRGVEGLVAEYTETEDRQSTRGLVAVATRRVYQMTRFHYLLNRVEEIQEVRSGAPFGALAERLVAGAEWVRRRLGGQVVEHVDRWVAAADPDRT